MKYHNSFRKSSSAFTLIELLIVIVIIAVLASIAFPVFNGAFSDAEKTRAKKDCAELSTAISVFFSDTNRYPVEQTMQTGEDAMIRSDSAFIAHMNGENDEWNRKKTAYYNGQEGKGDRGGLIREGEGWKLVDPWADMYYINLDTNRDKFILSPFDSSSKKYTAALVYSYGQDRTMNTEDDVKSW